MSMPHQFDNFIQPSTNPVYRNSPAEKRLIAKILGTKLSSEREEEMIHFIQTTLNEAHTRKHPLCLLSLTAAMTVVFKKKTSSAYINLQYSKEFRQSHPEFVRDTLDFALRQQNIDKIRALIRSLHACSCDKSDPLIKSFHDADETPGEPWLIFMSFSRSLWRLLCVFAGDLALPKLDRMKERKKTRGKDTGYEGFLHYLDREPENLLNSIYVWFKETLVPGVVEFLLRARSLQPHAVERALGGVPQLAMALQDAIGGLVTIALEGRSFEEYQLSDMKVFLMFLTLINTFSEPVKKAFYEPYALRMYLSTLSIFYAFFQAGKFPGSDRFEAEIFPALSRHACLIYPYQPEENRKKNALPDFLINYALKEDNTFPGTTTQCTAVWDSMRYYGMARKCLHLQCGKLPPSSLKSWRKCGRCKVVSYCSEACQKAAWSNPESPHKEICKDWAKLRTVWPLTVDAISTKLVGDGMPAINDGLKAMALPLGYGEAEMGRLFMLTANLGLQIHRQIGSDPLEG